MLRHILGLVLVQWARSDCAKGCTLSSTQFPFQCVDLSGGSTAAGTLIEVWRCNGLKNQEWLFKNNTIRYAADPTKCMTVKGGAISSGTKVSLEGCNGQATQLWKIDQAGRISVGGAQKFCLAPIGDSFLPGTNVQLFVCTYYTDQQWTLTPGIKPPPVPEPDFSKAISIMSEATPSKCVDVPGGKAIAGNVLDLWDCNGLTNQKWLFHSDGSIRYSGNTSMCVDIKGGVIKKGTNVELAKCNGQDRQQFSFDFNTSTVIAASTGKSGASNATLCLDIPGGNATNGAKLWLWSCNEYPQQQWYAFNAVGMVTDAVLV